jgi:hypothetical protein
VPNEVLVLEESTVVEPDWNPFNGVCAPLGYTLTGKLALLCLRPTSKFFSPILKSGSSRGLDKDKRKKGGGGSIPKFQEGCTTIGMRLALTDVFLAKIW